MKKFWNWARDETAPDARVLRLEGTIAEESWFEDDVTPAAFKGELFSDTGPVTIWINSPGGDCVAAAQIYNMLMDYPGEITVKIDGIAASAASVLPTPICASRIKMPGASMVLAASIAACCTAFGAKPNRFANSSGSAMVVCAAQGEAVSCLSHSRHARSARSG